MTLLDDVVKLYLQKSQGIYTASSIAYVVDTIVLLGKKKTTAQAVRKAFESYAQLSADQLAPSRTLAHDITERIVNHAQKVKLPKKKQLEQLPSIDDLKDNVADDQRFTLDDTNLHFDSLQDLAASIKEKAKQFINPKRWSQQRVTPEPAPEAAPEEVAEPVPTTIQKVEAQIEKREPTAKETITISENQINVLEQLKLDVSKRYHRIQQAIEEQSIREASLLSLLEDVKIERQAIDMKEKAIRIRLLQETDPAMQHLMSAIDKRLMALKQERQLLELSRAEKLSNQASYQKHLALAQEVQTRVQAKEEEIATYELQAQKILSQLEERIREKKLALAKLEEDTATAHMTHAQIKKLQQYIQSQRLVEQKLREQLLATFEREQAQRSEQEEKIATLRYEISLRNHDVNVSKKHIARLEQYIKEQQKTILNLDKMLQDKGVVIGTKVLSITKKKSTKEKAPTTTIKSSLHHLASHIDTIKPKPITADNEDIHELITQAQDALNTDDFLTFETTYERIRESYKLMEESAANVVRPQIIALHKSYLDKVNV